MIENVSNYHNLIVFVKEMEKFREHEKEFKMK